jgi:transposase
LLPYAIDRVKTQSIYSSLHKLTPEELESLPELLAQGATEYGFLEELWTCERVAQVIEWEFSVRYHKGHVSRLLMDLAWTPQKPLVFDIRRDEEEVARWRKEVWPELKKRRGVKTASLPVLTRQPFIVQKPDI